MISQRTTNNRIKRLSTSSTSEISQAPLSYVRVDLGAIAHNVGALKQHLGPNVELMAVVKANAYGHGAVEVAQVALQNGASRLAVARIAEGVQLRQAGITAPILIMGYFLPFEAEAIVANDLTPTVNSLETARILSETARTFSTHYPGACESGYWHGAFWLAA